MRKYIALAVLAIPAIAFAVNRSIIYSTASVATTDVHLHLIADGGCSAEVVASVLQLDGGDGYVKRSPMTELSGVPQTRCLSTLNSADALWKANEGL